jgi:hypothetical protein
VLRTLSKLNLAGVRLHCWPEADWLAEIEKTRLPLQQSASISSPASSRSGTTRSSKEQAKTIRQQRGELLRRLQALPGLTVYPSAANFILFRVPSGRGGAVFEGLKSNGILIKNLAGSAPALADCLRVTVGKPEENGLRGGAGVPALGSGLIGSHRGRALTDPRLHREALALARAIQLDHGVGVLVRDDLHCLACIIDRLLVDRQHDIPGQDPGLVGRPAAQYPESARHWCRQVEDCARSAVGPAPRCRASRARHVHAR